MNKLCPICEVGELEDAFTEGLHYSTCPHCLSETANSIQVSMNKALQLMKTSGALREPYFTIPSGLTREEKRALILSKVNKDKGD